MVFADYDKIENFMKIDAQMVPKSHPKIDIWAIRASTFEVSGGFGRSLIFDEFSDGGKTAKNRQSWRLGAATKRMRADLGKGRRAGRWPQEAFGV